MAEIQRLESELERLRAQPTPRNGREQFEGVFSRLYAEAEEIRSMLKPEITVVVPEEVFINSQAPEVRVTVPDQTDAINALATMLSQLMEAIAAIEPSVTVNVPEQPVQLTITEPAERMPTTQTVTFKRNKQGWIESAVITED